MSIWEIISKYFTFFGYGIATTLFLAIVGTLGGLFFGLFLALGRTLHISSYDHFIVKIIKKVINFLCYLYIQVFRGTPMMLQGMIFFLAIPLMIGNDFSWTTIGDNVIFNGYLLCGSIVIILNTSAYIGEILRGGINSLDKGQEECALSLGMTRFQAMFYVILPQAIKNSIPSIGNELIVNIKDSSVLNVIMITELFYAAQTAYTDTYNIIASYGTVCIIYLILTLGVAQILKLIEKRFQVGHLKKIKRGNIHG